MIRIRKWWWDMVFLACARLSNYALMKRSKACGCEPCARVARLLSVIKMRPRADAHAVELN